MAQLPPLTAWEDALDLDDSDIGFDPPAPTPIPRPCSTTPSHDDKPPHPSHHHVPEPAAVVQDVVRRRSAAISPLSLRRADAQAPNADFLLPPWLCALQFLGSDRAWEQPGIRAIKDKETLCRAPLVAGVVTSCKPNGLGHLLVTLKDPTGTIAAAVHKKVLLEGDNGQDISIGCVILVSKVAVFRPTRKACYLNITKVIKVLRKDCDAPSKQVVSSNTNETSEGSTNNIMTRLLGHERMMPIQPSKKEMRVIEVSVQHQGTSDSNNSTAACDSYGRCGLGNKQEGGLQMLAGDSHSKNRLNCCTDGHPQQSSNIPNMTCLQSGLCGSAVMFGDRYSSQANDNEHLRPPHNNEKMLPTRKKLKTCTAPSDGNGGTANSRVYTENNHGLERNMTGTELDDMAEQLNGQLASIREPIENQRRDFITVSAGSVQPTKEYAATISGSLLNPKTTLSVASVEWTDEQLCQLFADY